MARRRSWAIGLTLIGALVLVGAVTIRAALPGGLARLRDGSDAQVARDVNEAFRETVFPRPTPAQIEVAQAALDAALSRASRRDAALAGLAIELRPGRVCLALQSGLAGMQLSIACATPIVRDGLVRLSDREGGFAVAYRVDAIADAVEADLAAAFAHAGVVPVSISVASGTLTIGFKAGGSPVAAARTRLAAGFHPMSRKRSYLR